MSRGVVVGCVWVLLSGCAAGSGGMASEAPVESSQQEVRDEGESEAAASEATAAEAPQEETFEVPGFGEVTDAEYAALVEQGRSARVQATLAELEAELKAHAEGEVPPRLGDGEGVDDVAERLAYLREIDGFWRAAFSVLSGDWEAEEMLALEHELASRGAARDRETSGELRAYLENNPWPSITRVGEQASADAWRIVQHADYAPEFQAAVLERLKGQVEEGHVAAHHVAMLEDRVAMHRGEAQRYGTQGQCGPSGWEPFEVEAPEELDARRAAVGLEPMDEYKLRFESMCSPSAPALR